MTTESIIPIVMPKWGLSMKEGTLSAWHVEEGQAIKPGQEIMDVETDKIANAVEAADSGLLRRRVGQVGAVYPVKALLGVLAPAEVSDAEIDEYVRNFVVPAAGADEDEEGPAYRYIETASGRLRYAERPGQGNPIILIHGFGGDLNNWLFNIDAVAEAGPVYALDLPGHGESVKAIPKPGLDALTDAVEHFMSGLDLKDAHLVGHSMGGAVAVNLARRGRGLVRSLTLISSAGLGKEINSGYIEGFTTAESRRELKPLLQELFADPDLVSRQMIDDVLKFKRLDGVPETLAALAGAMFQHNSQLNVLSQELASLNLPVQIIWGAKDAIIPVKHAQEAPKARVEIIENAGHMAQMEAASRVNELIRIQAAN
ncbi:acetoin dehydrogenase dihydrolipoyllysine-residue acetyltransferase subunit [Bradyrhizobium sp. CCBAU 21360]|uniref:acetoin dehydrogenase dihydrolipoyllysine-residue acetyltransferase subunit n=1 Tax=Bradyrhizobium sp. CCBAU 21360 TaxID=1325081 RepID=UPI002305B28B|nr:acetoin dehydrogenase dihydrolipoyllysine-residue acetyltransferase subunit [Bradyrhizobium sp. CCBAU 21360]MDA9448347.1 acetoin dehydrogenase [Bradyrhizobium sp. CCBAU 21360]